MKQDIKRQEDIIETKEEVGKVKEEIEQELTDIIVQDKAKEMIERQNNEKLCRKTKDMLIENSAFKESLHRKLDTKDEIGKVNKGRKNNKNNLKEKVNSNSVVKVKVEKVEVVNKKDKKCDSLKEKIN